MKYNSRYSIYVFATTNDCYIYDDKEQHTVDGKIFGTSTDARRHLRNVLKQRPCKTERD